MRGDNPSSREKREDLAADAEGRTGGSYTLKLRHTGSPCIGGGAGPLIQDDMSATLATSQDQILFQIVSGCLTPWDTQTNRVYGDGGASFTICANSDKSGLNRQSVLTRSGESYVVRRLMPVECERLQGFPDDWTDLGGTPDAPRYKALGNSMAVPVINHIGRRIEAVDSIF